MFHGGTERQKVKEGEERKTILLMDRWNSVEGLAKSD